MFDRESLQSFALDPSRFRMSSLQDIASLRPLCVLLSVWIYDIHFVGTDSVAGFKGNCKFPLSPTLKSGQSNSTIVPSDSASVVDVLWLSAQVTLLVLEDETSSQSLNPLLSFLNDIFWSSFRLSVKSSSARYKRRYGRSSGASGGMRETEEKRVPERASLSFARISSKSNAKTIAAKPKKYSAFPCNARYDMTDSSLVQTIQEIKNSTSRATLRL